MNAPASPASPASPATPLIPDPKRPHLFRIPSDRPIFAVDVSKDTLVGALDDRKRPKLIGKERPNTVKGVERLLKETPDHCCWVLEPTGRYSDLAVDMARAAGRTVLLADPRRAKAHIRGSAERAKTDRLDSLGLADYAASRPMPLYPRPTEVIEQAKQLLSARKGLSHALSRLNQQRASLKHASTALEPACRALGEQIALIDEQLAAMVKDEAHASELGKATKLQAVPGIGPVTATAVAAVLQSRRFSHPDQFVAYSGLDIKVNESGKKKGRGEISSRGDAEIRRLLYLAAQANLRCKDSPFKEQYDRERAKGLPPTGAICAVARKLARVCWSLVKYDAEYDPARVYSKPKPKAAHAMPDSPISTDGA